MLHRFRSSSLKPTVDTVVNLSPSLSALQMFDEMPDSIATEIDNTDNQTIDFEVLSIQTETIVVVNESHGVKDTPINISDYVVDYYVDSLVMNSFAWNPGLLANHVPVSSRNFSFDPGPRVVNSLCSTRNTSLFDPLASALLDSRHSFLELVPTFILQAILKFEPPAPTLFALDNDPKSPDPITTLTSISIHHGISNMVFQFQTHILDSETSAILFCSVRSHSTRIFSKVLSEFWENQIWVTFSIRKAIKIIYTKLQRVMVLIASPRFASSLAKQLNNVIEHSGRPIALLLIASHDVSVNSNQNLEVLQSKIPRSLYFVIGTHFQHHVFGNFDILVAGLRLHVDVDFHSTNWLLDTGQVFVATSYFRSVVQTFDSFGDSPFGFSTDSLLRVTQVANPFDELPDRTCLGSTSTIFFPAPQLGATAVVLRFHVWDKCVRWKGGTTTLLFFHITKQPSWPIILTQESTSDCYVSSCLHPKSYELRAHLGHGPYGATALCIVGILGTDFFYLTLASKSLLTRANFSINQPILEPALGTDGSNPASTLIIQSVVIEGDISACSGASLVHKKRVYFYSSFNIHGIAPVSGRYSCMLSLFGQVWFLWVIHDILAISNSPWDVKLDLHQKKWGWGWSKVVVFMFYERYLRLMMTLKDKMTHPLDFLVITMGWKRSYIQLGGSFSSTPITNALVSTRHFHFPQIKQRESKHFVWALTPFDILYGHQPPTIQCDIKLQPHSHGVPCLHRHKRLCISYFSLHRVFTKFGSITSTMMLRPKFYLPKCDIIIL
ncbi:hypothetical protein Hdeb2414_s0027g00693281 [Helianthus debilis subsp. tardiflorus]